MVPRPTVNDVALEAKILDILNTVDDRNEFAPIYDAFENTTAPASYIRTGISPSSIIESLPPSGVALEVHLEPHLTDMRIPCAL